MNEVGTEQAGGEMKKSPDRSSRTRQLLASCSRLTLVALTSIALSSCGNSPSEPETENADKLLPHLLGEWAWQCSTGGFAGETVCAATSGLIQTWEFRTDSVFLWTRADTVVVTGAFRIVRLGPWIGGDSINVLVLNETLTVLALEMPTQDSLIATEQCYDCFTSRWSRTR